MQATRVGGDADTDVALIKVAASRLTAIPLGDSDKLRVGDFVVGVGYPFQLGQTVTSGIVSALHRGGLGLEPYEDFIQTDASANPGDSGGAPDAVLPGETGYVVPGRDVAEVADRVSELLLDPDRAAAMGERGRAWVDECWGWDRSARRLANLLAPQAQRAT